MLKHALLLQFYSSVTIGTTACSLVSVSPMYMYTACSSAIFGCIACRLVSVCPRKHFCDRYPLAGLPITGYPTTTPHPLPHPLPSYHRRQYFLYLFPFKSRLAAYTHGIDYPMIYSPCRVYSTAFPTVASHVTPCISMIVCWTTFMLSYNSFCGSRAPYPANTAPMATEQLLLMIMVFIVAAVVEKMDFIVKIMIRNWVLW